MRFSSQKIEKNTVSEAFVRQMLGENAMTGGVVRHRNDWSLAIIIETLKTDGVDAAMEVAQHLVQLHPNSVDLLVRLYALIKNDYGSSTMGKKIAFIYSKIKFQQMENLSDISRTPPMHTTSWMLKRVGEMVDQTAGVLRAKQLGMLKYKPVLLLSERDEISNSAFLPYLKDAFEIITEQKDAQAYLTQPIVPRLDTYLMYFNDDVFGHASEYEAPLNDLVHRTDLPKHLFELKSSTRSIAQKFLQKFGLKNDDKFVTLHVREEGYVDHSTHFHRNSNPQLFQNSIDYLVEQGIKIVRIGHPKMTPLREQAGFIDLTRVERPGEVDLYLCASNWFYFGSSSGPLSIAYQFGRPSLLIDFFPFGTARPNCFHQTKSFYENDKSRMLSFNELKQMDLDTVFSADVYNRKHLNALGATENEIKNALLTMLNIGPDNLLKRNFESHSFENVYHGESLNVLFCENSNAA
jgi:putative glycosyltransferase (TIGR04372 family)